MKRTAFAIAAIAAASLGLVAVSQAQSGPGFGPGFGHGPGMGRGMGPGAGYFGNGTRSPVANAEAHLATVRAQLNITSEQESAWQAFAATVTQHAQQKQAMHDQMTQSTATGPERMVLMPQMMQQHAAGMTAVSQALSGLYAVLTAEQRAIVDEQFAAHHGPRGHWGG